MGEGFVPSRVAVEREGFVPSRMAVESGVKVDVSTERAVKRAETMFIDEFFAEA